MMGNIVVCYVEVYTSDGITGCMISFLLLLLFFHPFM